MYVFFLKQELWIYSNYIKSRGMRILRKLCLYSSNKYSKRLALLYIFHDFFSRKAWLFSCKYKCHRYVATHFACLSHHFFSYPHIRQLIMHMTRMKTSSAAATTDGGASSVYFWWNCCCCCCPCGAVSVVAVHVFYLLHSIPQASYIWKIMHAI